MPIYPILLTLICLVVASPAVAETTQSPTSESVAPSSADPLLALDDVSDDVSDDDWYSLFYFGLRFNTGFVKGTSAKLLSDKSGYETSKLTSLHSGMQLTLAYDQAFTHYLSLAAEGSIGFSWLGDHTIDHYDLHDSQVTLDLSVELVVRLFPQGFWKTDIDPLGVEGFFVGFGLGAQWLLLKSPSYTAWVPAARIGWLFRDTDHAHSLAIELAYATPFLSGVSGSGLPTDTDTQTSTRPANTFRMHSFSLSMRLSF